MDFKKQVVIDYLKDLLPNYVAIGKQIDNVEIARLIVELEDEK